MSESVTGVERADLSKMDCENALAKIYEFLDHEIDDATGDAIRQHLSGCEPCLEHFDLEAGVKALINRCCGGDKAPDALRSKVMGQLAAAQRRAADA